MREIEHLGRDRFAARIGEGLANGEPVGSDIPPAAAPAARHDDGAAIGFEGARLADRTFQRVEINWLKHRLYLALEAGCTQVMGWLSARVARFQAVNQTAHFGFRQRIALRLCVKAIPLSQLLLQFHQFLVHRHLRLLGLEQFVDRIGREGLDLVEVRVRLSSELNQPADSLDRAFEHAGRPCAKRKGLLDG